MKRLLFFLLALLPLVSSGQSVINQGAAGSNVNWLNNVGFKGYMKLPVISGSPGAISGTYRLGLNGLMVYDSTNKIPYINNGTSWVAVGSGSSLPTQTGNSGKYLTTNGTTASWATVSGGTSNQHKVYNAVTDFGATADGITDNTFVFTAALDTIKAHHGGKLIIPAGFYIGNIPIPSVDAPEFISIEIEGEYQPPLVFGTVGTFTMLNYGTIIYSSSTTKDVIYQENGSTSFNLSTITLRNLEVRTSADPVRSAINLSNTSQCKLENIFANNGVYGVEALARTHTSAGIITPAAGNGANTVLTNVIVTSFYDGIRVNEHTDGNNVTVAECYNGLNFQAGAHASHFVRYGAYRNTNHIYVSGVCRFGIDQMNTEYPTGGQTNVNTAWQILKYDVKDPRNLGIGDITYATVSGAGGWDYQFFKSGGEYIRCRAIGDPYPTFIAAIPLSGYTALTTISAGWINTNDVWSNPNAGLYGFFNLVLPAGGDGSFAMQYQTDAQGTSIAATPNGLGTQVQIQFTNAGNVAYYSAGGSVTDIGAAVVGNFYRLKRTSGIWTAETSSNRGGSWTTIYTFGGSYVGGDYEVYSQEGMYGPASKVYFPQGLGLVSL